MFSTLGLNYSKVCGQLRGYQFGGPDGFRSYYSSYLTIDDTYVDGVSITYGSAPRKHIWTYANGLNFGFPGIPTVVCPCNTGSGFSSPPFVGTVRLAIVIKVVAIIISFLAILCGMDSNVLVWRLPVVLTPTCRGSIRRSVRPPLRTLN